LGGKVSTSWKQGESGNPKGRPPKNRTLTDILEKAGNLKREVGGTSYAQKQMVAALLWQAATTGTITFPDGITKALDVQDWTGIVKFIYQHIDGPPKTEMDVDGKIMLMVTYGDDGTNSPAS
jgi:hypothetical protein